MIPGRVGGGSETETRKATGYLGEPCACVCAWGIGGVVFKG